MTLTEHSSGELPGILSDPREAIASMPMSTAQKLGVVTTLLLTTTDGYDILAMSFAGPSITAEWHLAHRTLGYVMAMNLIGMGFGSVLIAPFADRFGRRRMILVALVAIAMSMLLSAAVTTLPQLAMLRLITGLCIGGMVGPTLSLATEYANLRNRALTASIMSIGLPLGGVLGAAVAARLLLQYDWRLIFIVGAAFTALVAAISCFSLHEAVDFLVWRPDLRSRARLNRILRLYGRNEVPVGYAPPERAKPNHAYAGLFAPEMRWTTLAMVAINFCMMTTIYFLLGWLPQIVADLGFSASEAATVSLYQNLGGIIGALALGWAGRRYQPIRLTLLAMAATAIAVIVVAWVPADLAWLRASAAVQGFMALATSAGIYGVLGSAFPAQIRSTGAGVSFGFGRLGTIAATIIPGILFTAGWRNVAVAPMMAAGGFVAMVVLFAWSRQKLGRLAWR